ncbi:MAG: DNA polymerase III subunit alpha [Elusimicrobiota bacterium]|jgi:DNA polymerase-3 subunit alpha|nr:DNA polymerase III subunit alpha [Elusimicrobiota bacterium]
MAEFIHLHNHTEYSLLDGACRITDDKGNPSELFRLIGKEYKMKALAITDHGNMFGAMEFYWAAQKSGIKPIIGCEIYVAPGSRFTKEQNDPDDDSGYYNHLILLSKDLDGYRNLMKIVSIGYTEGFYYKPRVDKEVLQKYSAGLIALSGCIAGEIPAALNKDNYKKALEASIFYRDLFGKDNFYIEIMDHGLENEKKVLPGLLEISKETGIPLVATNDCHFLKKEDHEAHDILICIGTDKQIDEIKRLRYPNSVYYKSAEEMENLFSYAPSALKNTLAIAEKINLEIKSGQLLLPKFEVPKEYRDDKEYLEKLCRDGLKKRYGENIAEVYNKRLEQELAVINEMGFASYFLIVSDFIKYAKDNNIPVGPGRGSGAGAITAYTLGITDICPIKNGLLFERFLNPARHSMPDLDIDFADTGRDQVIDYVRNKYGLDKTAQIITFGSMQARQAIKDVARTMGFTPSEANNIAKLIPHKLKITIAKALEESKELSDKINSDPRIAKLIEFAQKIEGLKRHSGVHAAGMVIADEEIRNYSPLAKGSKEIITTQYDGKILPKLGLLKVDFLGLRTLTIIDDCIRLIKEENKDFDIDKIPLDDAATYQLLAQAKTMGIFQLESDGLRDLMRRLKPESIDDITAMIALYRPGPMNMLDDFVARKQGNTEIKYGHPLLEPILKETYGAMIYQEQAMRISIDLASFTPGEADDLRKAMSKKEPEIMAAQRQKFVEGAQKKGITKRTADKIYDNIEKFGGYGFNKSHSAAYALVSYRTAYLKAHYPIKYITAMLNSEINRTGSRGGEESSMVKYLRDADEFGIAVLPPDVQNSDVKFKIEGRNIRFGLLAIKTVGEGAAQSIVSARKEGGGFKDWDDFLQKVDLKSLNKRALENLAKAGAFDCFGAKKEKIRAQIIKSADSAVDKAAKVKSDKYSNQGFLFDSGQSLSQSNSLLDAEELNSKEILGFEKEALGFYLSGHPLDSIKRDIALCSDFSLDNIPELAEGKTRQVKIAGMISNINKNRSKRGNEYAKFRIEDLDGSLEGIIFQKALQKFGGLLIDENIVVLEGTLKGVEEVLADDEDDAATAVPAKPDFQVESIKLLSEEKKKAGESKESVFIKLSAVRYDKILAQELTSLFKEHKGNSRVILNIDDPMHGKFLIDTKYGVLCNDNFINEIEKTVGKSDIVRFG